MVLRQRNAASAQSESGAAAPAAAPGASATGKPTADAGKRLEAKSCNIHEETHGGKETFAVGVKVIAYPNAIAVVYVGVMVVFPKPSSTELASLHTYR